MSTGLTRLVQPIGRLRLLSTPPRMRSSRRRTSYEHPWLSMASSQRIDNLLVDLATRVAGPAARNAATLWVAKRLLARTNRTSFGRLLPIAPPTGYQARSCYPYEDLRYAAFRRATIRPRVYVGLGLKPPRRVTWQSSNGPPGRVGARPNDCAASGRATGAKSRTAFDTLGRCSTSSPSLGRQAARSMDNRSVGPCG